VPFTSEHTISSGESSDKRFSNFMTEEEGKTVIKLKRKIRRFSTKED
jgi:hypothetical protein